MSPTNLRHLNKNLTVLVFEKNKKVSSRRKNLFEQKIAYAAGFPKEK